MVEVIFRIILIAVVVAVVLGFACTLGIAFDLPLEFLDLLASFLRIVCYILPMDKLWPIFTVVVSITIFKVGVSIMKTIWNLFPFRP